MVLCALLYIFVKYKNIHNVYYTEILTRSQEIFFESSKNMDNVNLYWEAIKDAGRIECGTSPSNNTALFGLYITTFVASDFC